MASQYSLSFSTKHQQASSTLVFVALGCPVDVLLKPKRSCDEDRPKPDIQQRNSRDQQKVLPSEIAALEGKTVVQDANDK